MSSLIDYISAPKRAIIFLVFLVAVVYLPSIHNSFVGGDDDLIILNNPILDQPLSEISAFFASPLGEGAASHYYRPLVSVELMLVHKVWHNNPLGFHITNITLHLLSVIFLFHVGLLLFRNERLTGLIAASLFAVHPVHNETVGRAAISDGRYGFFIIVSLYFFLKEMRKSSLAAYAFALLSKETAIMFPIALGFLVISRKGIKKGSVEMIPFAVIIILYLVARNMAIGPVLGIGDMLSYSQVLTMLTAAFDYLKLLVLPYPLHPYYSARIYSAIQEPHVLLAVGVMAISAVLLYRKRKQQELTFLAAWTFLMLIPPILMTNAFLWGPDHVYISERYLYVSAMPFSLLAAGVASVLAREGRESQVLIAWAAIIIAFSVISLSANTMWKDGRSLYVRIIKEGPNTAFAHNNLGVIFMDQKHFDEATREFRAALNVKPDYAVARYNLGLVHYNRGSFLEAIQEFNFALAINPDYADAQLNIGNACLKSGMIDQAIQSYKTAIQLNNNYALAHFNLGIAYEMKGSNESALVEYQEAIRISPGYSQAKNNIEALKQRLNYRR